MAQSAVFLSGNLLKHITVMSVTASVGLLALFVVDLVDMLFISMLGNAQLAAAVGYAGSILFFTTSVGIGLSIAAGSLIARSLGEEDTDRAREYMTHVMVIGLIFSILFAGMIWVNLRPLTALVGATGEAQDFAVSYLQIIIPSMPLLMCGMVAAAALRSHGAAKIIHHGDLNGGDRQRRARSNLYLHIEHGVRGCGMGVRGRAHRHVLYRNLANHEPIRWIGTLVTLGDQNRFPPDHCHRNSCCIGQHCCPPLVPHTSPAPHPNSAKRQLLAWRSSVV